MLVIFEVHIQEKEFSFFLVNRSWRITTQTRELESLVHVCGHKMFNFTARALILPWMELTSLISNIFEKAKLSNKVTYVILDVLKTIKMLWEFSKIQQLPKMIIFSGKGLVALKRRIVKNLWYESREIFFPQK